MTERIRRALISVSDKSGLLPFARGLAKNSIEIISTGGTSKALREGGVEVKDLSSYTGFPEMLDGRVKTLHPKIHGGLLYLRGNASHESAVRSHGIEPIDLVVVNLYPFEQTVAREGVTLEEAIENIDIGGPSMLRSAAKNHESVTVIVDPADYEAVMKEIKDNGNTSLGMRRRLAAKIFARTAAYDRAIAEYLSRYFESGPAPASKPAGMQVEGTFRLELPLAQTLRYGENPHQKGQLFGRFNDYFQQLHGKELSYNNILDLTAAAELMASFAGDKPTLAILKHTNPCGVGQAEELVQAWDKAFATDQQAPFGGIIASNCLFDGPAAKRVAEIFSEVIVAPAFSEEALEVLRQKKNLRLIRSLKHSKDPFVVRSVGAESVLVQEADFREIKVTDLKVVTERKPTGEELAAMLFGWRIVKQVKSNAIVYAASDRTLGVGAGQMSRVDASCIAVWKAKAAGLSLSGSAVCSDAFFPFTDGLVAASQAGATAAIQPGGSVRDAEVIEEANRRKMAMAFTGVRHFRH